jgi:hypothetical protein
MYTRAPKAFGNSPLAAGGCGNKCGSRATWGLFSFFSKVVLQKDPTADGFCGKAPFFLFFHS